MTEPQANHTGTLPGGKDPRTIITPHAFSVNEGLLYTPLASPLKRALAISIDGLVISVLAEEAGVVFVLLVLLASLLNKRLARIGRYAKLAIYLLMTLVLVYVVSDNIQNRGQDVTGTGTSQTDALSATQLLTLLPATTALALCDNPSCAAEQAEVLATKLAASSLSREEAEALLYGTLDEVSLTDAERTALKARLSAHLTHLPERRAGIDEPDIPTATLSPAAADTAQTDDTPLANEKVSYGRDGENKLPDHTFKSAEAPSMGNYSLIEWVKGILNDLGLGFGWAAFYFTVFTAWFDGQTLGKKLLGIRVISLDGSKLGLWAAFGRYGGYGAGFATGLLGFLQVCWDANRQAIQDKISSTVVIDLTKPRQIPDSEGNLT
ncbi:RDD family protein [Shewanella litorisediminis]|uniref:RDD family protein n=1 Tax=Shewanella litorisediminis TaxID=1173586 RepID=A0ABX7G7G2_9GAMM|nr:RDD family protein [Shewanella litorisediminis]MCL2919811.1 RDD family protein [Shewanella litorisediminis]QRH03219.1 RDD family protein [Shewanella litorisediminis]